MHLRRVVWAAAVAGVGSLIVVPVARADAPTNDDMADATVVPGLPHDEDVDLSEATVEADEPDCYSIVYVDEPAVAQSSGDVEARRLNPRSLGLKTSHEEPSRVTTNTVWYSYTASSAERVSIDTFGSAEGQDTMLAVYTRDDEGVLQLVTCNDDANAERASRVVYDAEAGREYLVQLGAWFGAADSAHLHMEIAPPPGQISGLVTDDVTGAPIEHICVDAIEVAGSYWSWGLTTTLADGTYTLQLEPGQYQVAFYDCGIAPEDDFYYDEEYYDDVQYWEDATPVVVEPAADVPGIDAGLALVEGNPWAPGDVAITALDVERVIPQIDGATLVGPGTNRIVHIELANLGRGNAMGVLDVEICAVTASVRCTYLEPRDYELLRDETVRISLPWNGVGTIGDVEIRATAESCTSETDWENNTRMTSGYVTIGGTGIGVGAGRGSRSFGCSWW